ncbi:hypothetical protein TrRE_jg6710, partial [Triparma retinervis]
MNIRGIRTMTTKPPPPPPTTTGGGSNNNDDNSISGGSISGGSISGGSSGSRSRRSNGNETNNKNGDDNSNDEGSISAGLIRNQVGSASELWGDDKKLKRQLSALNRWGSQLSSVGKDDEAQARVNSEEAVSASTKTRKTVQIALTGNALITVAKFGAWMSSGSSAMLSEAIHSLVDSGNQALLLVGLRDVGKMNDASHPYGYGKSIYFWSLVSALGTFWLGAGVSLTHSVQELMHPTLDEITWHVWSVLGFSLLIDGWVFSKVVRGFYASKPSGVSMLAYLKTVRDPATIAVLLEDGAACTGVLIASAGIGLSHASGSPVFDGLAGVGVSGLLAGMGLILARLNQRYLLGQAVDREIVEGINEILLNRDSIENVQSVQSQWTGPYSFSYKAEVDIDGTYLAAKLMDRYQKEFLTSHTNQTMNSDLKVLLSWYAEDVMRTVEREVKEIEAEIRE